MEHPDPQGPTLQEAVFSVPAMTLRHCVRAISAPVRDVKGVFALEADTTTRTIRVQGPADPDAVLSAIAAAGYEAVVLNPRPLDGKQPEVTSHEHDRRSR